MRDKNPILYIRDILEAIQRIDQYLKDLSYDEFIKDHKTVDAVIRNYEIIGEAAKNISTDIKHENPGIAWKRMIGMRDKLVHEYFGVDTKILYDTYKTDLKESKPKLEQLL